MAFGRWIVGEQNAQAVKTLCKELEISPLTASVLLARGHATPELAREFLEHDAAVEDPLHLKDIDIAAARINAAIAAEERIAVFGDYDVDGITSTALMWMCLQGCGADVVCSLPTRESSGYGLSNEAIDNLHAFGVRLIVTVDNGVSAYAEVAYAASLGIDVVVCDHHLPPAKLPPAVAVVDPLRSDDTSKFKELAGVGVALKLASVVMDCPMEEMLDFYGYLVAIGTVSDVMPLVGENRAIVKLGLEQLHQCDNAGLCALCEVGEIDLGALTSGDIAFGIAPRLNAAGRMDSADIALQLLLCDDGEEAYALAEKLVALNTLRRDTEQEIMTRINEGIRHDPSLLKQPIVLIAAEDLHAGVTGIVCSRLVERYGKPVVIVSIEGGMAKGSGRSVAGFSLHEAIASCADLLIKYGGHDMAAGFTLATKDIDALRAGLLRYCRTAPHGVPWPVFGVDALVRFADVCEATVAELDCLRPFGCANEEPVFGVQNAEIADIAPMNAKHSKVTLRKDGATLSGAVFGKTPAQLPWKQGDRVDAAFLLSVYHAPNRDMVSVRFRDLRPAGIEDSVFQSLHAYQTICAQRELTETDRQLLALSREAVAYIYKRIQKQPVDRADIAALCSRFPDLNAGKTLAVLDILEQLAFVQTTVEADGSCLVYAVSAPEKKPLNNAPLYRILSEEEADDVSSVKTADQ